MLQKNEAVVSTRVGKLYVVLVVNGLRVANTMRTGTKRQLCKEPDPTQLEVAEVWDSRRELVQRMSSAQSLMQPEHQRVGYAEMIGSRVDGFT